MNSEAEQVSAGAGTDQKTIHTLSLLREGEGGPGSSREPRIVEPSIMAVGVGDNRINAYIHWGLNE